MLRTMTIAAASCFVLMAPAAFHADASSVQPTYVTGFASSVTTVTYQQPVTFTGELVEGAARTPVSNELVQIEVQPPDLGQFAPVATGTTGSDGHFTIATTLPTGGYVIAAFAGDTGLAPSRSPSLVVNDTPLPTRLVLDPVPASVSAGTPVTFSGTLQVQSAGTWEPAQGAPLTLIKDPYTSSQPSAAYVTTTGADGRFSLTEPVTETSGWSVENSLNSVFYGGWFQEYARSSYGWIEGVSKTQIAGFSLPATEEAHAAAANGLYATGTVQRWNGSSWVGLAYGWLQFYYEPKGSTNWRKDYSAQTDAYGQFHAVVGIHLGTADWQARVIAAPDTLTSTSTNTVISTITDRTRFASASIRRTSSGSWINGQVTDWSNGQPTFSSLRGLTLRLYYRPKSSTTWHAYKTTTVGTNGYFQFSEAKSYGYYFKVVLPAQGPFLSCTSGTL